MTTSPFAERLQQVTGGSVHLARIAIIVIAFLANLVVWLIARAADVNLLATGMGADGPAKIGIPELIFGSLSWSIGAIVVFMLIERFAPNPRQWWLVIAVIALALSFTSIITGSENTGTTVTLSIMHIVAAAIIIPGFAATLRRQDPG